MASNVNETIKYIISDVLLSTFTNIMQH